MKVEHHTVISAAISAAIYSSSRSWELALSSFVAGVAIDIDHFLDFFLEFGLRPDWRNFFRSFYEGQYRRNYVLLHSWELFPMLGLAAWLSRWNPFVVGVLLGGSQHMILDQLFNGTGCLGYSLLCRFVKGFSPAWAFPYKKRSMRTLDDVARQNHA